MGNKAFGVRPDSIAAPVDATPPSTPGGLAAAVTIQPSVTFTWDASTDNVAVIGYQVYRGGVPIFFRDMRLPGATRTFVDGTVQFGNTYLYAVQAVDAAGNASAISAAFSVAVGNQNVAFDTTREIIFQEDVSSAADPRALGIVADPEGDPFIVDFAGIASGTPFNAAWNDEDETYDYTTPGVVSGFEKVWQIYLQANDVIPIDSTPSGFAEIPEIVFVNGFTQTRLLGIYHKDTANRWTPGDIFNASNWQSNTRPPLKMQSTNLAISDAYVTYNPITTALTYNGNDTGVKARDLDVKYHEEGFAAMPFKIRVIRPDATFGNQTYAQLTGITGVSHEYPNNAPVGFTNRTLGNLVSQRTSPTSVGKFDAASDSNMILITQNDAPGPRFFCATINTFPNGFESFYLVGVPTGPRSQTAMGIIGSGNGQITVKRCRHFYFGNLFTSAIKLGSEDCNRHTCDNFYMTRIHGVDGIQFDNTTPWFPADTPQYCWIVNAEFTRCGSDGIKHPTYIHLRDDPLGSRSGGDAFCHFNNVWTYGNSNQQTINGVCPQGGVNIKTTAKYNTIRNLKSEQTDNWADPLNGWTSSQVTAFHAHTRCVIYNSYIKMFNTNGNANFGQDKAIFFQNRNLADTGGDDPSHFTTDPALPAVPPYEVTSVVVSSINLSTNRLNYPSTVLPRAVTFTTTGTMPTYIDPADGLTKSINPAITYYLFSQATAVNALLSTSPGGAGNPQQVQLDFVTTGTGTLTIHAFDDSLVLNPVYHGVNDYKTIIPPVNAPYWTTVGDPADPTNPLSYFKFISYCTFERVTIGDDRLVCSALVDDGNQPTAPIAPLQAAQVFYNVPPNYVERSQMFVANNTYIGFNSALDSRLRRYLLTNQRAVGKVFPYATDPDEPRPDPIGISSTGQFQTVSLGGETSPEAPVAFVTLPAAFKT